MNENLNIGLNPEEKRRKQEQEDAELLADYLSRHPEPVISTTTREAEIKIAELEKMISSFESKYSLTELHAIVDLSPDLATLFRYADDLASPQRIADTIKTYAKHNPGYVQVYNRKIATARAIVLTPEDAKKFEIRMAAKKDLALIIAILNTLNSKKLKIKCKRLMKAVGSVIDNKVSHE